MGIINRDGYCHARVHASVTPTVPHSSIFSSFWLFLLIGSSSWPYYHLLQCYHFCDATAFCNVTAFSDVTAFLMLQPSGT